MSKTAVAVLEPEAITPEVLAPQVEASWDRARQLVAEIGDWHKIIELGRVLQALREDFFRVGQGRRSDLFPHAEKGSKPSESGWCEVVKSELGISPQTALRRMETGMQVEKIAAVIEMDEVEYEDSKGQVKKFIPTPDMREKAKEVLADVVAGANAGRAWAGLVGEGLRRGKHGTPDRAEVDHGANLKAGIKKLKTSLPHWKKLKPEVRLEIENLWSEINAIVPETWEMP